MRKLLLLICLTIYYAFAYAQEQQHQVNLDKNEMIVESIYLGEKGFILKTGNPSYAGKGTNRLLYFTDKGVLVWEKKIDNEYQAIVSENLTVAAPDGSIVYHIELKMGRLAGEKQYLTQINQKGEVKKTEIAMGDDYGKSLQSVFCDEQFLYYLTTENGYEYSERKKGNEKLILNRFTHDGLIHKKFVMDLPVITDPGSFWSFAGQNKQGKYLISKILEPGANQQTFDLVTFDSEGKVIKKIAITYEVGDKFVRPANCISLSEGGLVHLGSRNVVNMNFKFNINSSMHLITRIPGSVSGHNTTTIFAGSPALPTNAAFGYLYLDAANALYIYGLLGSYPFKTLNPGYEGFYVYKYDLNGKEIWKLRNPGSKELLDTKFYTTNGLPRDRYITLTSLPNQKQNFSIRVNKNFSAKPDVFLFDISEQGIVSQTRSTMGDAEESAAITVLSSKAKEYAKQQASIKSGAVLPTSFLTPSGEVLILSDEKERKLKVLFFKM